MCTLNRPLMIKTMKSKNKVMIAITSNEIKVSDLNWYITNIPFTKKIITDNICYLIIDKNDFESNCLLIVDRNFDYSGEDILNYIGSGNSGFGTFISEDPIEVTNESTGAIMGIILVSALFLFVVGRKITV